MSIGLYKKMMKLVIIWSESFINMSDIKIRELLKLIDKVDQLIDKIDRIPALVSFRLNCDIMRNSFIMSLVAEQTNKFKEELFAVALHPDRILQWMDEVDEIWRK
jgi:hypothetical protein